MSTTVIASVHPLLSLYLKPWSSPAVDREAIEATLVTHGLTLLDTSPLFDGLEAIVSSGLSPDRAQALAIDLRSHGLTTRVVHDPTITRSSRLGETLVMLLLVALFTAPLIVPALLAAVNLAYLALQGNQLLPVTRVRTEAPEQDIGQQVLRRIQALRDELPAPVVDSLLERARALARQAAHDPDGPARQGLERLLAELRDGEVEQTERQVDALAADLAHARRAARETQRQA